MIVQGIGGRKNKKEEIKRVIDLCKLMKGEKLDIIKVRKERAKETCPRKQPEREIRNQIIKELRKKGIKVMRVENAITGKNNTGLPDLWVVNINKNKAGWIEIKSEKGILQDHQRIFREDCIRCNVNHWVVYSLTDAIINIL